MTIDDWEIFTWQRANSLLRQAERIQRNFHEVAVRSHYRAFQNGGSCWQPPVNVLENGESISVVVALPGVKPESVQIALEGNLLTIAGERPLPACCTEGNLKMWEIPLGSFERRLRLGENRGTLEIAQSSLRDGLLIVQLRKNL